LAGEARRVAAPLLDQYGDFDEVSLSLVRSFAQSCGRLAELQQVGAIGAIADSRALHRELRISIELARALRVEPPR
jgi:hypothetical protein